MKKSTVYLLLTQSFRDDRYDATLAQYDKSTRDKRVYNVLLLLLYNIIYISTRENIVSIFRETPCNLIGNTRHLFSIHIARILLFQPFTERVFTAAAVIQSLWLRRLNSTKSVYYIVLHRLLKNYNSKNYINIYYGYYYIR